jgi:hypothetical protein
MEPILSKYCAHCGHERANHRDWATGGCRVQTRGSQFGDDDYCGCRAFVEQHCVYQTETGEGSGHLALAAWQTADGRSFVIIKDPWGRERFEGAKLTWLTEQLPVALEALSTQGEGQ